MTTRPIATTPEAPKAADDGRRARLCWVRDQVAPNGAAGWPLPDRLQIALEMAAPELRFSIVGANRAVVDPLASGLAGARDFRVAAALGPARLQRGDVVVVEAVTASGSTVLRMRSARPAALADLRAPAIEGLCSHSDPASAHEIELIALAVVAVAVTAEAGGDARRTAALAALVERMTLPLMRQGRADANAQHPGAAIERRVLAAWALAWVGLARGVVVALWGVV
jgi:hypothetical protein